MVPPSCLETLFIGRFHFLESVFQGAKGEAPRLTSKDKHSPISCFALVFALLLRVHIVSSLSSCLAEVPSETSGKIQSRFGQARIALQGRALLTSRANRRRSIMSLSQSKTLKHQTLFLIQT